MVLGTPGSRTAFAFRCHPGHAQHAQQRTARASCTAPTAPMCVAGWHTHVMREALAQRYAHAQQAHTDPHATCFGHRSLSYMNA
eukprot:4434751-Alexandrium_andersonii.AAC.1